MTLLLAISIAQNAHKGQMGTTQNQDEPFVQHPLRVMNMVRKKYSLDASGYGHDVSVVAVLHDVVEDTDITIDNLKEQGLTDRQAAALDAITRKEGQTYLEHIHVCAENDIAWEVKKFDLLDKIPSTKGSLHDKYELAFYILTHREHR